MHAFRCALPLVSLVFGEVLFFFCGSASLYDWFLHFLQVHIIVLCIHSELRVRIRVGARVSVVQFIDL